MGKIREFICPSCHETWQIQVGHGIRHATLDNVLDAFPKEIQVKIKGAAEEVPLFAFDYHAALCLQCKKIVSVPVITFLETSQRYSSDCPECGNPVFILPEKSQIACPSCQKSQLSVKNTGRWD